MLTWQRLLPALAAALGMLWPAAGARAQGPQEDQSLLEVSLRLEKGSLAVRRSASSFKASEAFQAASGIDVDTARELLFDQLDSFLAEREKPYRLALGPAESDLDEAGRLSDGLTAEIRALTTPDWEKARRRFDEWAAAGPSRRGLAEVVLRDFANMEDVVAGTALSQKTALVAFDVDDFSDPGLARLRLNPVRGTVGFRVADPMGTGAGAAEIVYLNHATADTAALAPETVSAALAPLRGRPWSWSGIERRLRQLYTRLGLLPFLKVSLAGERPRRIEILESPRIARVLIPESPAGEKSATAKVLYLLLEHDDYRSLRRQGEDFDRILPTEAGMKVLDYETLGYTRGTEPYLDETRLRTRIQALGAVGFTVAPVATLARTQDEDVRYRDLQVQKLKKDDDGKADGDGAADVDAGNPAGGEPDDATEDKREATQELLKISERRAKRRTVGGGAEWRPDQGISYFGFFRVRSLSGADDDLLLTLGGFEGEGQGDVSYSVSYLAFGRLHRPLSIHARSGVDYEAARRFGTEELDERRRRGFFRTGLEVFRNRRGQTLKLSAALERNEVKLLGGDGPLGEVDFSTLDLELSYSRSARYSRKGRLLLFPWTLQAAPKLKLGLDLQGDEPRFELFTLALACHRHLPAWLEVDLRGFVALASSDTPLVEQPSLGGLDNLRGFRADAAVAKRLWTLRSELWIPAGRARDGERGFRKFLATKVHLAAFADVGEASGSVFSSDGTYAGAGAGLRFDFGGTILSLDWGYGFESPFADQREGKVYLSFRQNLE